MTRHELLITLVDIIAKQIEIYPLRSFPFIEDMIMKVLSYSAHECADDIIKTFTENESVILARYNEQLRHILIKNIKSSEHAYYWAVDIGDVEKMLPLITNDKYKAAFDRKILYRSK